MFYTFFLCHYCDMVTTHCTSLIRGTAGYQSIAVFEHLY
jgi:hypothetical protein